MKRKSLIAIALLTTCVSLSVSSFGAEPTKDKAPAAKVKPYTLKTCVVSGDKLGGDMGDPYVFTYQGREIKMCCKDCRKEFDKNPSKFLKKIDAAEKKAAAEKKSSDVTK